MEIDLFEYSDYRKYLNRVFSKGHKDLYGNKSMLAKHLNCQSSYISQVCTFRTHLNLEHGLKISEYLGLDTSATEYFLVLIQLERAGTPKLRGHFEDQRKKILSSRELIQSQIKVKDQITLEDQTTYYSNWYYSAVHIACALPNINSDLELSRLLHLPIDLTSETVNFLISCGLINRAKNKDLVIGKKRIHVGENSRFINNHHRNWRLQAIKQIEFREKEDLCYSGVLAISTEDATKIKKIFLNAIRLSEPIINESLEENLYTVLLDFSRLKT